MKTPINHVMIRMDETIRVLDNLRREIKREQGSDSPDLALIDMVEKKIRSLETRKRLIVIEGGRT
jgi:hypothetical protein